MGRREPEKHLLDSFREAQEWAGEGRGHSRLIGGVRAPRGFQRQHRLGPEQGPDRGCFMDNFTSCTPHPKMAVASSL